jgi:acetylcholinesterase
LEFQFERFSRNAGCASTADELECLRGKDTLTLQVANKPSAYPGATGPPHFYFTPCIDGDFLQDYPILLFEQGKFIKVAVIFGDDQDEGSYFAANASTPADVAAFMVDQFPHLTPAQTNAINVEYPLMPPEKVLLPARPSLFFNSTSNILIHTRSGATASTSNKQT